MKPNLLTLLIALSSSFIVFLLGLGGAAFVAVNSVEIPEPVVVAEEKEELGEGKKPTAKTAKEPHSPEEENLKGIAEELGQWKQELEKEKKRMLTMDQELIRRETVLKREREALEGEKEKLLQLQADLESKVLTIKQAEVQNYKELAALFGKMKVDQIIVFMRMFPDDQTSRLMSLMPRKTLVKILEGWSTKHPEDRERLMQITSQIRRVIREPYVSSTGGNS